MDQIDTKRVFLNLKNEDYHRTLHIQISFSFNKIFWFLMQISKKSTLPVDNRKNEHHHWFLHIWISLSTNFQLKVTILILWTKFAKKKVFPVTNWKVNIIIELRISKLVLVSNFCLNWQFWFFWPDLPKKGFSGLKQKKWTPHIFYIILHIQISLVRNFSSNWQFWFFGSNLPKKVFPRENSPRTTSLCFLCSKR